MPCCTHECRREVLINKLVCNKAIWYQVDCVPHAVTRPTIHLTPYCSQRTSTSCVMLCMSPCTTLHVTLPFINSQSCQFPNHPSVILSYLSSLVLIPVQKPSNCNKKLRMSNIRRKDHMSTYNSDCLQRMISIFSKRCEIYINKEIKQQEDLAYYLKMTYRY